MLNRLCPLLLWLLPASAFAWTPHLVGTTADNAQGVLVSDLDGDGDADLVLSATGGNEVALFENLGGGVFGGAQTLPTSGVSPRSARAVDLDGDGRLDLLLNHESGAEWLRNLGGLGFAAGVAPAPAVWLGLGGVDAADLDGDGDLDLILAEAWGDKLHLVDNLGGGVFGPPSEVVGAMQYSLTHAWVEAADLDGDGDPDLILGSDNDYYGNGETALMRNDAGTLVGPNPLGFAVKSVHAADLDGDGDLDLFTSGSGSSNTISYRNEGGTWSAPSIVGPCGDHHQSAAAGDVDGDGDADLVCASGTAADLYRSTPTGFSWDGPIEAGALWTEAIATGDIDGDGDVDVVLVDRNANSLTWYENTLAQATPPGLSDSGLGDTGTSGTTPGTPGGAPTVDSGSATGGLTSRGGEEAKGCGCQSAPTTGGWLWVGVGVLLQLGRSRATPRAQTAGGSRGRVSTRT